MLNARTDVIHKDAVYVGHPSKWSNPYRDRKDLSKEDKVKMYEEYLSERKDLMNSLIELKGKDLVCWCSSPLDKKVKPCHAHTLLKLASES